MIPIYTLHDCDGCMMGDCIGTPPKVISYGGGGILVSVSNLSDLSQTLSAMTLTLRAKLVACVSCVACAEVEGGQFPPTNRWKVT